MSRERRQSAFWWQKLLLVSGLGTMFLLATGVDEPPATADCCMEGEEEDYIVFDPPSATLKLNGSRVFTMSLYSGRQVSQFGASTGSPFLRNVNTISDTLHVFAKSDAELDSKVKDGIWAELVMREIDPAIYLKDKVEQEVVLIFLNSFGPGQNFNPIDVLTMGPTDAPVYARARRDDDTEWRGTVTITIDPYEFVPGGIH